MSVLEVVDRFRSGFESSRAAAFTIRYVTGQLAETSALRFVNRASVKGFSANISVLQIKWCGDVFTRVNLPEFMIELYSDVLASLDPSLTSCMDITLKQHSQPLILLLEFYQISSQFLQNLESLYIFNNGK